MSSKVRLVALSLFLAAALGFSQAAAKAPAGVEPGEPEILLPKTILEIEDLSVEKVEAKLPPEEELLPPERKLPALSVGEMVIGEPALPLAPGVLTEAAQAPRDRFLTTEILLGAGMQNRILGTISLKTMGGDPRFSILFNHETVDGFSGHGPGQAFNLRDDTLSGTLKVRLGGIDSDFAGAFSEGEYGLQGSVPASPSLNVPVTRLTRRISTTANLSASPLEWLTIVGSVEGGADSLLENGKDSLEGFRVVPSVSASARFGGVKVGLSTRYSYRSDPLQTDGQLHRVLANISLGIELPRSFILEGFGGLYWNSAGLVFPLGEARLTGAPWDFATIALGAGYRVTPYDMHDILTSNPLALPVSLEDDRGWFGDASVQFAATRDISVTARLSFMASERMLDMSNILDPGGTGLFPITQQSTIRPRLFSDLGLRWGITRTISLSAGYTREYLDAPFFAPRDSLRTELVALDTAGSLGGTLSILLEPPDGGSLQLPFVRLAGFWKISDAVKLRLDCDDLLWPLISDGKRYEVFPVYVQPGFRFTGSVGITL